MIQLYFSQGVPVRTRLAWIWSWVLVLAIPCVARAEHGSDALATYEDQSVGVRTIVPLGRDGMTLDRSGSITWDAFQGRDHHPIDEETFFESSAATTCGAGSAVKRSRSEALESPAEQPSPVG